MKPLRSTLVATVLATAFVAPPAHGAETTAPPSHLAAYSLDWLNYIDPADVPPARYGVCLVDSGVRVTPDTPATSSDGPIIARLAVDGGSGEPEGESAEYLHGTRMAMAMAAPQNDWGTIGAWTAAQVVSVRATTAGESTFRPNVYRLGINRCIQYMEDAQVPIAAINLSLGCGDCSLSADEQAALEDWVQNAHVNGASVVAAAGNDAGGVQVPGSVTGAFAVAGGDRSGGLCGYSSFGPQVAVTGPACPVDGADPVTGTPGSDAAGGSSVAAATTSTLLAALRTLRPAATWQQAEQWVRDSARVVDGRAVLDGRAAAQAAGLGDVVARADARRLAAAPPDGSATAPALNPPVPGDPLPPTAPARLPRPSITVCRFAHGQLRVRVANRPGRARLQVVADRLKADGLSVRSTRRAVRSGPGVILRTGWRPARVTVRLLPAPAPAGDGRRPSRPRLLYRHGCRYR